jgi:hypothetical protein
VIREVEISKNYVKKLNISIPVPYFFKESYLLFFILAHLDMAEWANYGGVFPKKIIRIWQHCCTRVRFSNYVFKHNRFIIFVRPIDSKISWKCGGSSETEAQEPGVTGNREKPWRQKQPRKKTGAASALLIFKSEYGQKSITDK